MARQADSESPAEATGAVASTDGQVRWPTWDDIARLHRIPGADGSVPEPPARPLPEPEPLPPEPPPIPEPEPPDPLPAPEPFPDVELPVEAEPADEAEGDDDTDAGNVVGPDDETGPDDGGGGPADAVVSDDLAPDAVSDSVAPDAVSDGVAPDAAADDSALTDPGATVVLPPAAAAGVAPVLALEASPAADASPVTAPERVSVLETAVPARTSVFPATTSAAAHSPRVTAGPVPMAEPGPSVLDTFPEQEHRRRWPLRLALVAGVLVVLAGAYVGMCYALRDKVPHGATVAGVEIGGLSSSDAVQRLTSQLADATGKPLTVTANDVHAQIDPAAAGLTFDPRATVDPLTGVDLADPRRLWQQIVGIGDVTPSTGVDRAALAAAINGLAGTLSADPVNGAIVFVDGAPHATPAQDGWKVDEGAAVQQVAATWLVAARPLALPTTTVHPDITQDETDATLADVAQHVSGGPVTVTIGDQTTTLPAATLAANASFVPKDGALVLQLNGQALAAAISAQIPGLLTPAADAHFEFQNDAPVIVPGQPGTTLDPSQVATAVAAAASKATDRTTALQLVPTDPAQSTAALEALGVKEIVSEFDTPLTSDHIRDINIRQGAANITGVLVRPGDTFSLTDALGPIDAAHGFVEGGAIVDGQHTNVMGGGLSQVSTTTYNAAYFAGFQLVEHTPHSEWFSRYPEGREATLFTGVIDLKWKNNTPYGALLQSWIGADDHLHVRIWGTTYWTVQSTTSARSNVRQPTVVYNQSPKCAPSGMGNPGFTVWVTRKVYLGAELTETKTWKTTYIPQNQVVCGPPPVTP